MTNRNMTTQAKQKTEYSEIGIEQVSDYLKNNPAFFDTNPELVSELQLSHDSGNTVSLIERQVQVLREQNRTLKTKFQNLIDVARENDQLNERLHKLTLEMIRSSSLNELITCMAQQLKDNFHADAFSTHIIGLDTAVQSDCTAYAIQDEKKFGELFESLVKTKQPTCGRFSDHQLNYLFPDSDSSIKSAAIVPFGTPATVGVLAIGSNDGSRFHSTMGTIYLSQLAELFSSLLSRHALST